jgi:type II secretory pathway pseudopilin PulG
MTTKRGLTIVDLMVALTILAVVLSVVYSVFASQDRALRAADQTRDVYGQGLSVLDRLSRDIGGVWLPTATAQGPGFLYRFSGSSDQLVLATTTRLSQDETQGPDLVEVGFRLIEDRDDPRGMKSLMRRQDDTPNQEAESEGAEIALTTDVVSLKFAYLDDTGEARDSWEAPLSANLPKAVRIELVLSSAENNEETFITLVSIPLAQPTVRPINLSQRINGSWPSTTGK